MSRWRRVQMMVLWVAARTLGRWSSLLGGWLASLLWFTPWPTQSTARSAQRESAWLADTQPLELSAGPWRLRGFSAGEGPTVLLVHGWGDHAARLGAFVAPLVLQGFRVVAVDMPGHGARGIARTDLPAMADALRLVAAQVGPIHAVIGHSMGATVSMIAVRDGMSPTALVLLAPPVRLEHAVSRFGEMLDLPERTLTGLRRRIERRFGTSVWRDYAADHLQLEVPTLLIHDADDPQVDISEGRMLAASWPDVEMVETAGLGHQRIVRDAGVVRAAVEFVAAAAPPLQSRQTPTAVEA